MSNESLFYIFGIALTLTALGVSFVGIRSEKFPGSRALFSGVVALFAVLVAGTAVFGVANARDEVEHRTHEQEEAEAELAAENAEAEGEEPGTGAESPAEPAPGEAPAEPPAGEPPAGGGGEAPPPPSGGPGDTLELAADPVELLFDETSLTSKPGEVTIELSNPSPVPHNVAFAQGGQTIQESETVSEADTSVTAELTPGTYEFLCTVPGHAEAGMRGTLTVK